MILIATVALVLRLLDFPMAPLLLGFILGGLMEDNLRRSLMIYGGSFSFLWERSITLTINLITLSLLATPVLQWFLARRGNPKVA
jgi:putative tricarboxylic transport membrane protein